MSKTILLAADIDSAPLKHEIVRVDSTVQAYREILTLSPDIVILNDHLLDGDAFDVLNFLRNANRCVPVILLSDRIPKSSSLEDRLSFVHTSISTFDLTNLVDKKLAMKAFDAYTLEEYVNLAKKGALSIEISICDGDQEEGNTILLQDGTIVESKLGDVRGLAAFNNLLKFKQVNIRFRKPGNNGEKRRNVDDEWHQMFFGAGRERSGIPTPIHGILGIKEHMMKQQKQPRNIGHGTGVSSFQDGIVYDDDEDFEKIEESRNHAFETQRTVEIPPIHALIEATESGNTPFPPAKSDPIAHNPKPAMKTNPLGSIRNIKEPSVAKITEPLANIEGLGIGELLDKAMEEMLSRQYEVAHFILKAALRISPQHTTALANLERLEQLLEDKQ